MKLYLKKPSAEEEQEWKNYIKEFRKIDINATPLGYYENINYKDDSLLKPLKKCSKEFSYGNTKIENENKGINMEEGRVPSTVFFLMNDGNKILGHISIRHNIDNAFLKLYGGHIGYGIRPSERNKGYGTIMLHLALIKCKELGLEDVMITCKDNNVGSYKTIENNYGIQKDLIYIKEENSYFRRYWINIDQSVLSFKML